jgi:hypothetical protein
MQYAQMQCTEAVYNQSAPPSPPPIVVLSPGVPLTQMQVCDCTGTLHWTREHGCPWNAIICAHTAAGHAEVAWWVRWVRWIPGGSMWTGHQPHPSIDTYRAHCDNLPGRARSSNRTRSHAQRAHQRELFHINSHGHKHNNNNCNSHNL